MTIAEKIESWLAHQVSEGRLRPGDRLPKYADIMDLFGIPYISVQRAFKTLEYEGKIKIVHGVGSFLIGGDDLDVDFYVTKTTFDLSQLQEFINALAAAHDLHLRFNVLPLHSADFQSDVTQHKAVIAETDASIQMDGTLMDYAQFPDFQEVVSQFRSFGSRGNVNLMLPFLCFTYQNVVNSNIVRQLGMVPEDLTDFSQWNRLTTACRQTGFHAAALSWLNRSLWNFPLFDLTSLFMLHAGRATKDLFRPPLYATPEGQRILQIAMDCHPTRFRDYDFLQGKTALCFNLGSWFTTQYTDRFHVSGDSFQIVPMRQGNFPIQLCEEMFLKTFTNSTITPNERQRLWQFLVLLTGRKAQKKLCAMSGAISPRMDMRPQDYAWLTREDFKFFLPTASTVFYSRKALTMEQTAALGAVCQCRQNTPFPDDSFALTLDQLLGERTDTVFTHTQKGEQGHETDQEKRFFYAD